MIPLKIFPRFRFPCFSHVFFSCHLYSGIHRVAHQFQARKNEKFPGENWCDNLNIEISLTVQRFSQNEFKNKLFFSLRRFFNFELERQSQHFEFFGWFRKKKSWFKFRIELVEWDGIKKEASSHNLPESRRRSTWIKSDTYLTEVGPCLLTWIKSLPDLQIVTQLHAIRLHWLKMSRFSTLSKRTCSKSLYRLESRLFTGCDEQFPICFSIFSYILGYKILFLDPHANSEVDLI